MSKRFDYYAGYPNQQKTPKWVGVALGSTFGCLILMMLAIGIRVMMPARTAEASRAPEAAALAQPAVAMDESALTVRAADEAAPQIEAAKPVRGVRHYAAKSKAHGSKKAVRGGIRLASHKPSAAPKRYQKAQMFAKSVSSGRRDKRARDELDKMLGL